ncbi:MAG: 2-hydroxyacyl-CoA dehydratase family protein [Deltaproteobacteria bacterium]|jgi:bzd-type benzoyl-CoA reductase N subunit
MPKLKQFHDIANDPSAYARKWKTQTRSRVVGFFCSYTPEEIIWAAGALPYRILGGGGSISSADGHLQAYSCSLVRGALDDVLTGKLDFLDGVVFPHTCDSIQRLSDIWRLNADLGFHLDLVLPVKLNTTSAEDYMQAVIKKFRHDLEDRLGVEITPEKLSNAVRTFNQIRTGLQRIYQIRKDHSEKLSSRDLHAIVKASMVMDRNVYADSLSAVVDQLQTQHSESAMPRKRLLLTGGICSMPEIYQEIEDAGGTVVWDDFCTGSRYFEGTIDLKGDLLNSIARRYFNRIICPAKHRDCFSRGDNLLKLVKNTEAQGVIFVLLKFCDPHAFDFPYIKELLDRDGIPSMLLEIEDQQTSEEQIRTRLEAFIELL